jgi:putative ABC transport system ATP-binding protein
VGAILEAERLARHFEVGDGTVLALDDVSFSIEQGSFIAVMGPSGSGKSTLLHMLGGLDRPTTGRVVLSGTDLSALSERDLTLFRRKATGFVFQFFNLLPTLNVYENVAVPFMISGRKSKADMERIDDLLMLFGLEDKTRRPVSQLSAGEQQRVAIARAFLTEPAIVIGDEPTGNLDSASGRELLQLLWESCDNYGQTILVVTHDPGVAIFADRVLVLQDGALVDDYEMGRREQHFDARPLLDHLQEQGLWGY